MPAWKIGTSKRSELGKSNVNTPGPGEYKFALDSYKYQSSKFSMGKDKRNTFSPDSKNVGPGSYNFQNLIGNGPKYTASNRSQSTKSLLNVPGPGTYSQTLSSKVPKYSFRPKCNSQSTTSLKYPGPGTYDQSTNVYNAYRSPDYKIGTQKRKPYDIKNVPGPGAYDNFDDSKGLKTPRCFIGSENRNTNLNNNTPGPGTYTSHDLIKYSGQTEGKGVTMKFRHTYSDKFTTPGVGNYSLNRELSANTYVFGKDARSSFNDKSRNPGPDTYDGHQCSSSQKRNSPKYSMGSSSRPNLTQALSPGPAAYDHSFNSSRNISYSFRSKLGSLPSESLRNPGPHEYNSIIQENYKVASPKYSIGKGTRDSNRNSILKVPGPGEYDTIKVKKVPNYVFGKEKQNPSFIESPGPGTYEIKTTIGQV